MVGDNLPTQRSANTKGTAIHLPLVETLNQHGDQYLTHDLNSSQLVGPNPLIDTQ